MGCFVFLSNSEGNLFFQFPRALVWILGGFFPKSSLSGKPPTKKHIPIGLYFSWNIMSLLLDFLSLQGAHHASGAYQKDWCRYKGLWRYFAAGVGSTFGDGFPFHNRWYQHTDWHCKSVLVYQTEFGTRGVGPQLASYFEPYTDCFVRGRLHLQRSNQNAWYFCVAAPLEGQIHALFSVVPLCFRRNQVVGNWNTEYDNETDRFQFEYAVRRMGFGAGCSSSRWPKIYIDRTTGWLVISQTALEFFLEVDSSDKRLLSMWFERSLKQPESVVLEDWWPWVAWVLARWISYSATRKHYTM